MNQRMVMRFQVYASINQFGLIVANFCLVLMIPMPA